MSSYLAFWGQKEGVFTRVPGPGMLFRDPDADTDFSRLRHHMESFPSLCMISGARGIGKTSLVLRLREDLRPDTHDFLFLSLLQPELSNGWFLPKLCQAMGAKQELYANQALQFLAPQLDLLRASGRQLVIIIDQAECLQTPQALTEVQNLISIQTALGPAVALILVYSEASPLGFDLRAHLGPYLRYTLSLKPLSPQSTRLYVEHRLKMAGLSPQIMEEGLAEELHKESKGSYLRLNHQAEGRFIEAFINNERLLRTGLKKAPEPTPLSAPYIDLNLEKSDIKTPEKPKRGLSKLFFED